METIYTKFIPPLEPRGVLDRPRLRVRLADVAAHRLTLVHAPAGYGKTTLLAQWFEALKADGIVTGWMTLDQHERTLENLLASALSMVADDARFGAALGHFFRNETMANPDTLMASLVDRVSHIKEPIYLFIDDLQVVGETAMHGFNKLVQVLPHNVRFVVGTRTTRGLKLGALRAYGQLLELEQSELSFTESEATALLSEVLVQPLEADDLKVLFEKTEGWVTGLKLASFALLNDADRGRVLSSFSGRRRTVADFFLEHVFLHQGDDIRRFLLETSVLDRLSPQICDAMTGQSGSSAMLKHLEEIGLFIVALDDERNWYRYHSLFSEFLQRQVAELAPGSLHELHEKAAHWMVSQGQFDEALEHARQSGNFNLLGSILETAADEFTYTGRSGVVTRYAAMLPDTILAKCPRVALSVAWVKIRALSFEEARQPIELASRHLADLRADPEADAEAIDVLDFAIRHREAMLTAAQDDVISLESQCSQLLRHPESRQPYLSSTLQTQLIIAKREQFHLDDLEKLHANGRQAVENTDYRVALITLQAAAGISYFAKGRTDTALSTLEQGMTESVRWAGRNSALSSLVALPLAEIHYEANDLSGADELVADHLPHAREFGFADQLVAGYLVSARLRVAAGDIEAAHRVFNEAASIAIECDQERLQLAVIHDQVRLLIRNGLPEEAAMLADRANIPKNIDNLVPRLGTTTRDELRAAIWVRLALCSDRIGEALSVMRQWRSFTTQRRAVRSHVRWNILMAQGLALRGDPREAQRTMRVALTAAAPANLIRSFVDDGTSVLSILSDIGPTVLETDHPADRLSRIVLEAFDAKPNPIQSLSPTDEGLYGHLTNKELEILTLVGSGWRNREIGNHLGLSEGSVKWYMQQIYDKVGIRRRSQAVERARQFGLIT